MDFDFPTVISTPLKIDLEDPYATRFATLSNQEDRTTARNATNLRTEGPPPSTRVNQEPPDALEIARVIALRHGHLPNSQKFEELIYGPAEGKKLSQERHSKYGKLQETVFAEQSGKCSWFQAFCCGVVATENVRTLLTQYNLCAKALEIPPTRHIEAPEETRVRADHLASQFNKSRTIVDSKRVIDEGGPDYTTFEKPT
ncbi:hypothetical protein IQ07DRAFT_591876 [Pyrenochaeta sp. DS3sAY3a]|nr:hypothetical protein IQ07DRAFT_591876 [Pyrenochaeta sp. DS3sAY3a]